MNAEENKRSACRSRESLKRRRKRRVEKQNQKKASAVCKGRCQTEETQVNSDLATSKNNNAGLKRRLNDEIKKRKILEGENLELCRKLEKRLKTDPVKGKNAGTYTGQVQRVIESSKTQVSRKSTSGVIRKIDPSNLTGESPTILGEGTFGCVSKMLYNDRIAVAVKVLKGDANERHLLHEATAMQEIGDHPGVPYLYGVCVKDTSLMLVMECCSQGDRAITLSDAANSLELSHYSWSNILLKLTEALVFVHTKGYIHNDLKGNNVLLYKREEIWQPVIIDYGKCVKVSEAKARGISQCQPSLARKQGYYTAPEVLSGKHPPSHASDIYSLGIIFHKVNEKLPFNVVAEDIIRDCCIENPFSRIRDNDLLNKLQCKTVS